MQLLKKAKLSSLLHNFTTSHMDACYDLRKHIRSLENKAVRSLPESFIDHLMSLTCNKKSHNDQDDNTMPAMTKIANNQADPNISKCVAYGEAKAVLSGYSDFEMCIGNNCKCFDMMIKDRATDRKIHNHLDS